VTPPRHGEACAPPVRLIAHQEPDQ